MGEYYVPKGWVKGEPIVVDRAVTPSEVLIQIYQTESHPFDKKIGPEDIGLIYFNNLKSFTEWIVWWVK